MKKSRMMHKSEFPGKEAFVDAASRIVSKRKRPSLVSDESRTTILLWTRSANDKIRAIIEKTYSRTLQEWGVQGQEDEIDEGMHWDGALGVQAIERENKWLCTRSFRREIEDSGLDRGRYDRGEHEGRQDVGGILGGFQDACSRVGLIRKAMNKNYIFYFSIHCLF